MIPEYTVLAGSAKRHPGTVHVTLGTDQGAAVLRLTPAFAKQLGREMVRAGDAAPESASPATLPHAQTGGRAPLLKPSGRIV